MNRDFIYLDSVMITLLVIIALFLIIVIFDRKKQQIVNWLSAILVPVICILIASQLAFYSGVITDEYNLNGSSVSGYSFFVILIISLLTIILYFVFKNSFEEAKKHNK